jgi:hypothetical protein
MKSNLKKSITAILFTGSLLVASVMLAQTVEVTNSTTTSEGTVSEFGSQALIIKTETGAQPVRYINNETTNYVDEDGNPVTASMVKSGLPVTVYYTKVGDTLVASKVVIRKAVTTTPTATTTIGTITEFGPDRIMIRTESSPDPLGYTYTRATTYVDEDGRPVSMETVKSGLPVTVEYSRVGDTMMASKVIVRKAVPSSQAPLLRENKTTDTDARKDK